MDTDWIPNGYPSLEIFEYDLPNPTVDYDVIKVSIFPAYVVLFCRLTLIVAFAGSSFGKWRDVSLFVRTVDAFNILPRRVSRSAAIVFLIGELACGVFLLFDQFLIAGLLLAICLLGIFTLALIITLKRKNTVPCNCFGASNHPVSVYDVIRNLAFVLCAWLGWISLPFADGLPVSFVEIGLLGLMAIVFLLLMVNLSELAKLFTT